MRVVFHQFWLSGCEIVGRCGHHGGGACVCRSLRETQRLVEHRVRHAHEDRHAARHLRADAAHQLMSHGVRQVRCLAGGAQQEESVHSPREDVLHEARRAGGVEMPGVGERRHHRRHHAPQGLFESTFQFPVSL